MFFLLGYKYFVGYFLQNKCGRIYIQVVYCASYRLLAFYISDKLRYLLITEGLFQKLNDGGILAE